MSDDPFTAAISRDIWDTRYRYRDDAGEHDRSIRDTWRRVAEGAASVEGMASADWARRCYRILDDFRFLPGGRILAGTGTCHEVTLFNCFVMGVIEDSMDGIFEVPALYPLDAFKGIYRKAWKLGLKGCTTFRPNPVTARC